MTRVTIVNQHTNNYGDDIAGAALLNGVAALLNPSQIDIFYIWQRDNPGLPIDNPICTHHCLQVLSGRTDARAVLARHTLSFALTRRITHPELRELVSTCRDSDTIFVAPPARTLASIETGCTCLS